MGWAGLAQVVGLIIRLGSNILLARLLSPDAYGILGSAMAVLTTLEWLSDLGIQPALVRLERGQESSYLLTGWWLGLGRGLVISLAAMASALPLAAFTRQPEMFPVLLGLSLRPGIFALRSPGIPSLRRTLNYRALFADEVAQTAVGTAVSLSLAWATRSIWAIVAGTLAGALAGVVTSYILAPIRPRLSWDREAARDIGHLGRQVFVNTLVMALWLNMDRLIGLRFVTLSEMGLYAIAWNLASVAEALITRACDVYFAMLARRGTPNDQASWHGSINGRIARLIFPVGTLAVSSSPLAIGILYDRRYSGAKILFAIMVARLLVRSLGQFQFQYLLVRAEVHLATRAYVVALAVQTMLFALLVPQFGTRGLALASLGSTAALTFVQAWLISRRGGPGLEAFVSAAAALCCGLALAMAWA